MAEDDQLEVRIDEDELEMLRASMAATAFRRRAIIRAASGPEVDEQQHEGRPVPDHVAEQLDLFRQRAAPVVRLQLRDATLHTITDGLDMTIGGVFAPKPRPEPRDLLHVYDADRARTGEQRYYRYAWLDHSIHASPFSTPAPVIVRSGRLAGTCGVYGGQWGFSVGGAGMLFTADHGPARVDVRPYLPWLALTSFNHYAVDAAVRCDLGILIESWRPGDTHTQQERDHWITVLARNSGEGHLYDAPTSGTGTPTTHLRTDFVAVPGRRYAIYVYAWLETSGGRTVADGPLPYSRIELDASIPFVVAEETLL